MTELERWVKDGLPLHGIPTKLGQPASSHCRFCRQSLTNTRVAELEGHFNEQYATLMGALESASQELHLIATAFDPSNLPTKRELVEHRAEKYAAALADVTLEGQRLTTYVNGVTKALNEKKRQPFKAIAIDQFLVGLILPNKGQADSSLSELLSHIRAHNRECSDHLSMVSDARRELEIALVADSISDFDAKTTAGATLRARESELNDSLAAAATTIEELERDIVEHHKAADQLNVELARYLGRDDLKFRSEGNGYSITRAGEPANNLSEGEKTAIAFLYFLKSLQDKGFTLENDVVVIDDPVSSLDANALFSAFGYMKERTKGAGQLFILTHNFAFFRQVKNWFFWENGGPKSQRKDPTKLDAHFYMLECRQHTTGRNGQIRALDPLLWEYESEYHYLFKLVAENANAVPGASLETYYGLPNIARRMLEAFLSFRYPNQAGLRQQLDQVKCDPATRSRVIRFVHTYSHEGSVAEDHDPTVLAETPLVLREILDLIQQEDPGHFGEMMALVGTASDTGE